LLNFLLRFKDLVVLRNSPYTSYRNHSLGLKKIFIYARFISAMVKARFLYLIVLADKIRATTSDPFNRIMLLSRGGW